MARYPVSENSDIIDLPKHAFLDVQFCYSLPNEDKLDFDAKFCIVTTVSSNKMKREFKSVGYYENINNETLNTLIGDFAFISLVFEKDKASELVSMIKDFYSIG